MGRLRTTPPPWGYSPHGSRRGLFPWGETAPVPPPRVAGTHTRGSPWTGGGGGPSTPPPSPPPPPAPLGHPTSPYAPRYPLGIPASLQAPLGISAAPVPTAAPGIPPSPRESSSPRHRASRPRLHPRSPPLRPRASPAPPALTGRYGGRRGHRRERAQARARTAAAAVLKGPGRLRCHGGCGTEAEGQARRGRSGSRYPPCYRAGTVPHSPGRYRHGGEHRNTADPPLARSAPGLSRAQRVILGPGTAPWMPRRAQPAVPGVWPVCPRCSRCSRCSRCPPPPRGARRCTAAPQRSAPWRRRWERAPSPLPRVPPRRAPWSHPTPLRSPHVSISRRRGSCACAFFPSVLSGGRPERLRAKAEGSAHA